MTRRDDLGELAQAVRFARGVTGLTQTQFAAATGVHQSQISLYENGHRTPRRRTLERLAAGAHLSLSQLTRLLPAVRSAPGPYPSSASPEAAASLAAEVARAVSDAVLVALGDMPFGLLPPDVSFASPTAADRASAPDRWRRLVAFAPAERRLLIEGTEEYRSWALCELVCEESARAAADDPARALELAGLALFIAERALGGELWRTRLQGYAWAFLGNARRVGSDLRGAEQAFTRARVLWKAGAAADPGVLDASRLLDLEASLRRAQRRFPEAVALLDRALTVSPAAAGRILLKKAFTYEQMGDCERAIAALEQAAPRIDAEREPRLVWVHRLNLGVNLCHFGRFAEAEPLAAEARELAIALRNDLDLLRVLWLEARVAAGLGRRTEAIAALRQVRDEFAARGVGYDAALATLDLAVLLLEENRTVEVRSLAAEMRPIFGALEVHREALAALRLFWRAAEQEAATVELGRRLLTFLERARYDPELHFEPGPPRMAKRSPRRR